MEPTTPKSAEPMPIWFIVAGLMGSARPTVLSETKPALWWGAIMSVAGVLFTAIGWVGRPKD
jgi:hypothetical protein